MPLTPTELLNVAASFTVNVPYKLDAPVTPKVPVTPKLPPTLALLVTVKLLNVPPAPNETLEKGPKTTAPLNAAVPPKVLVLKNSLAVFLNATSITLLVPFTKRS